MTGNRRERSIERLMGAVWPGIKDQKGRPAGQEEKAHQYPEGHAKTEQRPFNLGAVTGTGDHRLEGVSEGKVLQHIGETRSAGRYLIRRQMLDPQMPNRDAGAKEGSEYAGNRITSGPSGTGRVNRAHQHDQPNQKNPKSLGNTQGAWLKALGELKKISRE